VRLDGLAPRDSSTKADSDEETSSASYAAVIPLVSTTSTDGVADVDTTIPVTASAETTAAGSVSHLLIAVLLGDGE
jgi:hypothetical protein